MTDEPDNSILRYLQRIDEKINSLQSDMREVKERLGILEVPYASLAVQSASLCRRVDAIDNRPSRIERRLDIVEAT